MPTLLFKKKFHDAIRSGRKTQTVRLWEKCRLKEGRAYRVAGLGLMRVTRIERVRISDLTENDALLDGFESRKELLDELQGIYNVKSLAGKWCFRVRFDFLGDEKRN